jgi:L-2,4-diaminobutyric acid acetyltransferase
MHVHAETSAAPSAAPSAVRYRRPEIADGSAMHALVRACPPLDLNSIYAYLLHCTHFRETCVLADSGDGLAGFATAYLQPADPSVLFVWQVAVSPRARGLGVAGRLLQELMRRPACGHVRYLETTITPSNAASWRLFRAFAREQQAACRESTLFEAADFGADGHEAERLLRIGPFDNGAA